MPTTGRNLQIDFFRGLALLSIYIDHIPNNPVSHVTINALGFFDAAEVFVFLSGFTAARVFGHALDQRPAFGVAQVLHRCWTLYIVHLFLFILFMAQVSWTATYFQNPMFAEEMQITRFLEEPHIAVLHALALDFQPTFLDILPLYIVLLASFVVVQPVLRRWPAVVLPIAIMVWAGVQARGWSPAAYPDGVWFFNPLAWQLLFIIGMAVGRNEADLSRLWHPWLVRLSIAVALLLGLLHLGLVTGETVDRVSPQLAQLVWPFADKTNLGIIRLADFLCVAHAVGYACRRMPQPAGLWARPVVRCGQHSLNVFCLGLLLSFLGHLVLVEIDQSLPTLIALNLGGIGVMVMSAFALHWYDQQKKMVIRQRP